MDVDGFFSFGSSKAARSERNHTPDTHHEFFKFLSIVRKLKVPILPLMWRPSLAMLGAGATGYISQAPMNRQTSFAFKRFQQWKGQTGCSKETFRFGQYEAFISEMAALQYPPLYHHPNIVNLEGLCWEVGPDGTDILPVLVFRQAQYDLDQFLTTKEGAMLSVEDRMAICGEIARALISIHSCGIVHGDIKPQNVLVYRAVEDPEVLGVKLADFGFSCLGSTNEDLVQLSGTRPWNAPEYHDNYFTLGDAKKADIYSFGLLCLWVIFRDHQLGYRKSSQLSVHEAFTDKNSTWSILEAMKDSGELFESVLQLMSKTPGLSSDVSAKLHEVFRISLQRYPLQRATDMGMMVELLSTSEEFGSINEPIPSEIIGEWHDTLQLEDIFYDLEACDFRIHQYLVDQLTDASKTSDSNCLSCSQKAMFQLAICSSFGFGTSLNLETATMHLQRSDKRDVHLQAALRRIRTMEVDTSAMRTLIGLGYTNHLSDDYVNSGIATEAIAQYRQMVSARETALGPNHFSTRRVRSILADVLDKNLEEGDALILREKELECLREDPSDTHKLLNILILQQTIAQTYEDLSRFKDSENLRLEILASLRSPLFNDVAMKKTLEPFILCGLARASYGQKDYQLAVDRGKDAVSVSEALLGAEHNNTMRSKNSLAKSLWKIGDKQAATEMMEDVVRSRRQAWGASSYDTVSSAETLACMHLDMGNVKEADMLFKELIEPAIIGSVNLPTSMLYVGRDYALSLAGRGFAETAKSILELKLANCKKIFGMHHKHTVQVIQDLEAAYSRSNSDADAEKLRQMVSEMAQR